MYCPIHNPSGGDYDPKKAQYKNRSHSIRQEFGRSSVTTISTERVPVVQKPFTPPDHIDPDAPSVVQLDNTRKIVSDFAAITITAGDENKRTFVFNAKLLASNSPARQIATALMYVTEERFYNRSERWAKQQRDGTNWLAVPTYASVDVVRCYDQGKFHTPPSPGPVGSQAMWESLQLTQPVTNDFVYLTGFKDTPIAQTKDYVFEYIQAEVNQIANDNKLTLEDREALLLSRIKKINTEMFLDVRNGKNLPRNYNDVIIHPLDLVSAALVWVGPNRVDDVFVTRDNTADLRNWFMPHNSFHVPNKQMFVDNGFNLADFNTDGSITIKSNVRMFSNFINEEKLYMETKYPDRGKYTDW